MPDIPFGATSTAADVLSGVRLDGRRALVTGGTSGLGLETARALASAGAEVTVAGRNPRAGQEAADALPTAVKTSVRFSALDLSDLGSVDALVERWEGPLHILVLNAGVMATPLERTAEGWELQLATNHLGHFALATGLHPALVAAGGARVVSVSSVGHVNADVDLDDLMFERRAYDPWTAYGQSKTANVLFAVEAAKRWAVDSVAVNALNPGRIAATGLGRHLAPAPASFDPAGSTGVSLKDVGQGAATSVLVAASPLVDGITGEYFEDCQIAGPHRPGVRRGVASYARDPQHAARLWEVSTGLLAAGRSARRP